MMRWAWLRVLWLMCIVVGWPLSTLLYLLIMCVEAELERGAPESMLLRDGIERR